MSIHHMKLLALAVFLSLGLAACDKLDSNNKDVEEETMGEATGVPGDNVNNNVSENVGETSTTFDDAGITTKVKSALISEPGLDSLQINVDTVDGVVTLTGTADSEANSQKAQQIASNAAGVVEVRNNLTVKATN